MRLLDLRELITVGLSMWGEVMGVVLPVSSVVVYCRGEGVGVRKGVEVDLLVAFKVSVGVLGSASGGSCSIGEASGVGCGWDDSGGVGGGGVGDFWVESSDSKLPCCKLAMPDILIGCRRRGSLLEE